MNLTDEEKNFLLNLAKDSIKSCLLNQDLIPKKPESKTLNSPCGAFVSLHIDKDLRGCIGTIKTDEPLYKTIRNMARAAAFEDPRFPPLSGEELKNLKIEISVLSPMKKVFSISEIEVGRDGLYIVKDVHRGLLLPQVATKHNWDKETFLNQTCIKAGLPAGAWKKGAAIMSFTAEVFSQAL